MALQTLNFFLRELSNSLKRNTLLMAAAVGTFACLVFLLGLFLLFFLHVQQVENALTSQMEIHAYLKANITREEAEALQPKITLLNGVKSAHYVDKQEAFQNLKKDTQGKINLSGLMSNPIPSYFSIQVNRPQDIAGIAGQVKEMPEVESVSDLQKAVNNFIFFFKTLYRFFLGLVILLFFSALFIIYNTIRLGIFSQRKEIEIMQLVGASPSLISWPFILEGAFYGLLGAFLAILFLEPTYHALVKKMGELLPVQLFVDSKTLWPLFGWLLVMGISLGSSGSFLSVKRYLRS